MKYYPLVAIISVLLSVSAFGQDLDDLRSYSVEEFYKKVELDRGTLGRDGRPIDFIFVKTELDAGTYEIELANGPGSLYEVKGTDFFIKFRGHFGYAGYGTKCILKVERGFRSSTVYRLR